MLTWLRDAAAALTASLAGRSGRWPACRRRHLEREPACQACGVTKGVEVHHVYPFSWPGGEDRELDPANLITLCPVHHLWFGHLGDWRSRNEGVRADAAAFHAKVAAREYPPVLGI